MKEIYVLVEKHKEHDECDRIIVGIEAESQKRAAALLGGELAQGGVDPAICFFRSQLEKDKKWKEIKLEHRPNVTVFQRIDCDLQILFYKNEMIKIPKELTLKVLRVIAEE